MWWQIGAGIVTGLLLLKNLLSDDTSETPSIHQLPPNTLAKNFARLREGLETRRGYKIAFIGQPGAGKSSLLANLTDRRCVPMPVIGPETDATDWSQSENITLFHTLGPFAFADAPGWGTERHPIDTFKRWFPFDTVHRLVVVLKDKIRTADATMYDEVARVVRMGQPINHKLILVRSFAENLDPQEIQQITDDMHSQFHGSDSYRLYFVSNRTKAGIPELKDFLFEDLI